MIKKLLYLILFILYPSLCFSQAGVVSWSTVDGPPVSCKITYTQYTQQDSCVYIPAGSSECSLSGSCTVYYGSSGGSGCKNAAFYCFYPSILPAPPGGCNITQYEDAVGGCGRSPIYCNTSSVYQKVSSFLGRIENASSWTYFSTIGQDNNIYKCALSYTRSSGGTVLLIAGSAMHKHNPVGSSICLNDSEFDALLNTNCDLTSGWAKNSGYITNYNTGQITQDTSKTEGPVVPPNSPVEGPTGQPINSPTGFDGNGDGFDDVTGQPIPFSPSDTGIKDTDGDGVGEVQIKDPAPESIPGVPSQGDFDTNINSPEAKPLSALFDVLDSSPFVSLLQGTRITLSGATCSLSSSAPVFGSNVSLDFCSSAVVDVLTYLGYIIVGLAAILAVLIIFT